MMNQLINNNSTNCLVNQLSIPAKNGTWTATKELEFDWNDANADGGEDQGLVMLRLLWEEIRGFDAEMLIPLK